MTLTLYRKGLRVLPKYLEPLKIQILELGCCQTKSPLKRFTTIMGLNYWNPMDFFVTECSTLKVLGLCLNSGLASIGAESMHYWNGWLALATSRNSTLVMFNLVLSSRVFSLNLPLVRNTSLQRRWNYTLRMWHHQWPSQVGWHIWRWTSSQEEAINPIQFVF